MIIVGIDPSFSGTGITVDWDGQIILQAELSSVRKKNATFYTNALLIDKCSMKETLLAHSHSDIDDGDMFRIIHYYHNMMEIIYNVNGFVNAVEPNKTEDWYYCIEIPFGGHMGAGAKIDRCYAAAILAINEALITMERYGISVYAISPKSVKKFITGNGNSKKDKVQECLINKFGYTTKYPKNFNLSDSYAIMQFMKNNIHTTHQNIL